MRSPNLFIIGAQKSGTTYLAKALSDHPDVYFSDPKEPLFFSSSKVDADSYQKYLETYFKAAKDQLWVGEGSTTYFQWPNALDALRSHVPGIPKFIVCMRHPVEKVISFYIHNWRRERYPVGTRISDTLSLPLTLSPLLTSTYADSIKRWFAVYPREAFCFLKFDQLQNNPADFVKSATDFLGIARPKAVMKKRVNAGFRLSWEGDTLFINDPNAPIENRPCFTRAELEVVLDQVMPDIAKTETLTGLELKTWRQFPKFGS